jgi:hypothetical protein
LKYQKREKKDKHQAVRTKSRVHEREKRILAFESASRQFTRMSKKLKQIQKPRNVGDQLIWSLVKNQNSFMVKGRVNDPQVILTGEPNNLTQQHSYRNSGLAQHHTIGLEAGKEGKGVVLTVPKKQVRATKKPSGRVSIVLARDWRANFNNVTRLTEKHRSDLV